MCARNDVCNAIDFDFVGYGVITCSESAHVLFVCFGDRSVLVMVDDFYRSSVVRDDYVSFEVFIAVF